jgi:uncharacterized damage-inducible protein DinB
MKTLVENVTNYNFWANQKIAHWLLRLPEEKLYQQATSSFESIDLTVQHIVRLQKFWFAFVKNEDVNNFDWSKRNRDAINIIAELVATSQQVKDFVKNCNANELSETLELNMPWAKNTLPRYEYIMHNNNHNTFHRGQIITIARQIGIIENIPNTDYNFFNTTDE